MVIGMLMCFFIIFFKKVILVYLQSCGTVPSSWEKWYIIDNTDAFSKATSLSIVIEMLSASLPSIYGLDPKRTDLSLYKIENLKLQLFCLLLLSVRDIQI